MPFTRNELILILLITAIGFAARFAFLDELAIEHFDEGVYASNLWFPDAGYAYPDRHLYAPPLLPAMIEFCLLTFGEAKWVPFLPALLLGSLTVPLAWLAGRQWFKPEVGLAVAAVMALNDFHIAMSRSALTDVPLLFFLLLAVWLASEALMRVDLRIAVAAGIATALAWATKYNGWLPIAISVTGVVAMLAVAHLRRLGAQPEPQPDEDDCLSLRDSAVVLAVMTGAAAVAWSPVWLGLEDVGGYSAVAENHRRYVVGFSGWLDSCWRHLETTNHYMGVTTLLGGHLAVIALWYMTSRRSTWNDVTLKPAFDLGSDGPDSVRSTWNPSISPIDVLVVFVLTILLTVPFLTAAVAICVLFRNAMSADRESLLSPDCVGVWLCAAWLCGLFAATPLYQPYPRLILPLLTITWFFLCAFGVSLIRSNAVTTDESEEVTPSVSDPTKETPSGQNAQWLQWLNHTLHGWRGYVAAGVVAAMLFPLIATNRRLAWQNRSGLAHAGELALAAAAEHSQGESNRKFDFVVYTYGEPGLFFHLPRDGVPVQPVSDLNFALPGSIHPRIPTFVLTGPNTLNDGNFAEHFAEAGDALEQIGVFPYEASDFVLLDDHRPHELDEHRIAELRLYRVRFP